MKPSAHRGMGDARTSSERHCLVAHIIHGCPLKSSGTSSILHNTEEAKNNLSHLVRTTTQIIPYADASRQTAQWGTILLAYPRVIAWWNSSSSSVVTAGTRILLVHLVCEEACIWRHRRPLRLCAPFLRVLRLLGFWLSVPLRIGLVCPLRTDIDRTCLDAFIDF